MTLQCLRGIGSATGTPSRTASSGIEKHVQTDGRLEHIKLIDQILLLTVLGLVLSLSQEFSLARRFKPCLEGTGVPQTLSLGTLVHYHTRSLDCLPEQAMKVASLAAMGQDLNRASATILATTMIAADGGADETEIQRAEVPADFASNCDVGNRVSLPVREPDLTDEIRVTQQVTPGGQHFPGPLHDGIQPPTTNETPRTSLGDVTDCATEFEQPIATDSLLSPALIAARLSQKRKRTSHLEEGGSPSMTLVRAAPRALQAAENETTSSPVAAGSPASRSLASTGEPSTGSTSQGSPTALERDISSEAFMQAEDTIVADSDEGATLVGDGTDDGGYDSDSGVSSSTSIASSVRDYLFENGRRYHRYREGIYDFPNDETEQGREDMKHATLKLLCNQKLHFAPIGSHPQEILDMGTGTGIWAIEMGEKFPSAHVLGLDLSPIQPDWVPPNVHFQVDDIESPWLHPRNHFDFIHARHTIMAFRDWMLLFRRSMEHLKPGGWIELQEILHEPHSMRENGPVPVDHPVGNYWSHIRQGLSERGVDLHGLKDGRLADKMREAGFIRVRERVLQVPVGTWPRNKVLKTVGVYWRTILLDGIQAIALGPMTRGLKWNRERVEVFLMDVRRSYFDNSLLMYMPLHIVYGQKPR